MARPKKYENGVREFKFYEDKPAKPGEHIPPTVRARREIINNPEARTMVGVALGEFRRAMKMPKVNSNAELMERLDEYFAMAQNREMPPTVEEMALYCGYVPSTLWDWKTGHNKGFSDIDFGYTTSEIIKKAYEVLHGTDVVLASTGKMNPVMYIWRGKNYYNEKDAQEVVVSTDNGLPPAMTAEEIAKHLPEPKHDGEIQTEYEVK